jgi:hypothetical protein
MSTTKSQLAIFTLGALAAILGVILIVPPRAASYPTSASEQQIAATTVVASSTATSRPQPMMVHQMLFDNLTPIEQPQGSANRVIRVSPEGSFCAFYTTKNGVSAIVILDRRNGSFATVPAPKERLFDFRSIRYFGWGDGPVLYVVEDATTGSQKIDELVTVSPHGQVHNETDKIFDVLYSWHPGEEQVKTLDKIPGIPLGLAVAKDQVKVIGDTKPKGLGIVVRSYENGQFVSERTFPVKLNGEEVNCDTPQLLIHRNELWFKTIVGWGTPHMRSWLATMKLDESRPTVRLIMSDMTHFAWTPDENTMIFCQFRQSNGNSNFDYYMVQHDALDKPRLIASVSHHHDGTWGFGPQIVGFSPDGRTMYCQVLAKPMVNSPHDLFANSNLQIYKYTLPN